MDDWDMNRRHDDFGVQVKGQGTHEDIGGLKIAVDDIDVLFQVLQAQQNLQPRRARAHGQ